MKRSTIHYVLLLASALALGTTQIQATEGNDWLQLANELVDTKIQLERERLGHEEDRHHNGCQSGCHNREELKVVLAEYGVQNYQIVSVCCCLCLVIGQRQTVEFDDVAETRRRLWYVNRCGALEELASIIGTIAITEYKVWDLCFFKALLISSNPDVEQSALAWQFLPHCGSLRRVESPEGFVPRDFSIQTHLLGDVHAFTEQWDGRLEAYPQTALKLEKPFVTAPTIAQLRRVVDPRHGKYLTSVVPLRRALEEENEAEELRLSRQAQHKRRILELERELAVREKHEAAPMARYRQPVPLTTKYVPKGSWKSQCAEMFEPERYSKEKPEYPSFRRQEPFGQVFRPDNFVFGDATPIRRPHLARKEYEAPKYKSLFREKLSVDYRKKSKLTAIAVNTTQEYDESIGTVVNNPTGSMFVVDNDPATFTVTTYGSNHPGKKRVMLSERCECGERFLVADMVVTIGQVDRNIRVVYRFCDGNLVEIFPKG